MVGLCRRSSRLRRARWWRRTSLTRFGRDRARRRHVLRPSGAVPFRERRERSAVRRKGRSRSRRTRQRSPSRVARLAGAGADGSFGAESSVRDHARTARATRRLWRRRAAGARRRSVTRRGPFYAANERAGARARGARDGEQGKAAPWKSSARSEDCASSTSTSSSSLTSTQTSSMCFVLPLPKMSL